MPMSVLYPCIFIVCFAFDKVLLKNSSTTATTTTTLDSRPASIAYVVSYKIIGNWLRGISKVLAGFIQKLEI